ncbi:MAG: FAD-binding oxidoreductase, partial [Elioraea tepidiphila]
MDMPAPDLGVIARKARILARLRSVLPADAVIDAPEELRVYECDALTAYRCPPLAAVLPRTTDEVSRVLRLCREEGVP